MKLNTRCSERYTYIMINALENPNMAMRIQEKLSYRFELVDEPVVYFDDDMRDIETFDLVTMNVPDDVFKHDVTLDAIARTIDVEDLIDNMVYMISNQPTRMSHLYMVIGKVNYSRMDGISLEMSIRCIFEPQYYTDEIPF